MERIQLNHVRRHEVIMVKLVNTYEKFRRFQVWRLTSEPPIKMCHLS